jgi:hypothetical protein
MLDRAQPEDWGEYPNIKLLSTGKRRNGTAPRDTP